MAAPVTVAAAPGRLDLLGGVADYGGSLVLETPIEGRTRVAVRSIEPARLRFVGEEPGEDVELPLDAIAACLAESLEGRRRWLDERAVPTFARYPFGCLLLLAEEKGARPQGGLEFTISSTVPRSMGVSSSAALEVATLRALRDHLGVTFHGTELARLAQRAENEVVGAPCGLMDQLTAEHGEPGAILPILCRPDVLEDPVPLPEGVAVVGWPSGVRHDVGASPYATARAATFMGFEILRRALAPGAAGRRLDHPAEVRPHELARHAEVVPERIRGDEYARRFGIVPDPLSVIDPGRTYPARAALAFPVHENARARLAARLLRGSGSDEGALREVGELLFQSHEGYTTIGLGCPETDRMVDLIDGLGAARGFYGARVSGGGSGGTVVVLMRLDALATLEASRRAFDVASARATPLLVSARRSRSS